MDVSIRPSSTDYKLATTEMLKQHLHESDDRGRTTYIGSLAGLLEYPSVPSPYT